VHNPAVHAERRDGSLGSETILRLHRFGRTVVVVVVVAAAVASQPGMLHIFHGRSLTWKTTSKDFGQ
jgi:hypothetical protein